MTPQLDGECNQCGRCCDADGFVCQHLETTGRMGEPFASRCRVYSIRYQGMPIMLWAKDRSGFQVGHCSKDSDEETQTILDRGIGHGCSLIRIEGV